ncbi:MULTISPECIES: hypothetical protein [Bacillus]|uniref:Uncharacterized protein n=1 Tax=Bacillus glycinifermentans TaxID=1664069 RepID=A0AAJ4D2E2_9BACI|nr:MULTISPECIES: hypothetical protein [Bacillus]KKB71735.1 hypothetical protein TH62_21425 [Bacillus sp. TH008]MDU0069831.1 hypothetical protein [Bacillus sp. IG6]MED8018117.1 hypothetical protein [Bacillus glycinifermentans]QAT65325.1 hypothetical protein EQZ20_10595 [Bacillus glycinifermentans]WKB79315.1 hypothetical protein QYM22_10890 [Bacillus glycinifermentans]
MTKDQLEAIRKRAEAATEGEWCEGYDHYVLIDNFKGSYQTFGVARCARKEDTEFIAHARQDIPALLDHIAELNQLISGCRCEECGDEVGVNWTEIGGAVYCKFCAGGDENSNNR